MNKRMSNKWGGKIAFSLNDWTESWSGTPIGSNSNQTKTDTQPLLQGGPVSILSGGSGKASFYSSFENRGLVHERHRPAPCFLRSLDPDHRSSGQHVPVSISTSMGSDGTGRLLVGNVEDRRYDNLWNVDFRLPRAEHQDGRITVTPSIELFNALNNNLVLSRARALSTASTFNRVEELISPRIFPACRRPPELLTKLRA